MIIDVYISFLYNIERAENLIDLIKIKKVRDELTSGIIQNLVDNIRLEIRSKFPILQQRPIIQKAIDQILHLIRTKIRPIIGQVTIG